MLFFEIDIVCILKGNFTSDFCEFFMIPFGLSQEKEYEVEEEYDSRVDEDIGPSCSTEYMTDEIQCFGNKCKEKESSSNREKYEKMQCIESFSTSNIIGNERYDNP